MRTDEFCENIIKPKETEITHNSQNERFSSRFFFFVSMRKSVGFYPNIPAGALDMKWLGFKIMVNKKEIQFMFV